MDCESRMQMVFSSFLGSTCASLESVDTALAVRDLFGITVWGVLVLEPGACTTLKPAGRVWSCLVGTGGDRVPSLTPLGSLRGATGWMGMLLPPGRESPERGAEGLEGEEPRGAFLSSEGLWRSRLLGRITTWCMIWSLVFWSSRGWTEILTGLPSFLSRPRASGTWYTTRTGLFGTGDEGPGDLPAMGAVAEDAAGSFSLAAGVGVKVGRELGG